MAYNSSGHRKPDGTEYTPEEWAALNPGSVEEVFGPDPYEGYSEPTVTGGMGGGNSGGGGGGGASTTPATGAPTGAAPPATSAGVPVFNPTTGKWEYKGTGYQGQTVGGAAGAFSPTTAGWNFNGQGFKPINVTDATAFQRSGTFSVPPPPKPPAPPPPAPDFMSVISRLGGPKMGPAYTPQNLDTGMLPDLEDYAREWLANPNRYNSEFVTSSRALMDADARSARETGINATSEWAAERGLIGSSYEGEQRIGLEDRIDQNRLAQQTELLELMALAEAQDRAAAGGFGLQVGELGRGYAADEREEGRYAFEAERQQARDFEAASLDRAGLELDAMMQGDASALARFNAEMDSVRLMEDAAMSREELKLRDEEINLRAWQIQEDNIRRGQEISLDQATAMADYEIRKNTLAQNWSTSERDREQRADDSARDDRRAEEAGNRENERYRTASEEERNRQQQNWTNAERDRELREYEALLEMAGML